jgi:hypothetical protein
MDLMELVRFLGWKHAFFAMETLLVLAALQFRIPLPKAGARLKRLARHRLAPLAVGALALLLRAAVLPIEPVPTPTVHDEFSYLLQADTFAHGRIASPTHPLWEFFETFHVDQHPTYASMYAPLQGLMLALGQVVAGAPFAGVWLSVGLMCAALTWALRGWFPPEWALMGGTVAAIRLAMFSYWGDSYWGGALAATGGALLFGALPRLLRASRVRDALLAALGVAMLANTRQYEGLAFSVAIGLVALGRWRRLRLRTVLPPFCAVLVAVGALMAYYNWRVFGSPAAIPYTVNRATYAMAPYFLFQTARPEPVYRHAAMRDFYVSWELATFESARSLGGYLSLCASKVYAAWSFYVGPVLTLPLFAVFWTWRSRRTGTLLFMAVVVAAFVSPVAFFEPHYIAPVTVVIYALLLQGMRFLGQRWPQALQSVPLVVAAMAAVRIAVGAAAIPMNLSEPLTWTREARAPVVREATIEELRGMGGTHVVFVRYGRSRNGFAEYVYNGADIDGSPIVWARDMGAERNAALKRYYPSRTYWLLEVGMGEPELSACGAANGC